MKLEEKRRPLFGEPTDDLEREDAWGEPKGFLVGGWLPSPEDFAQQSFDAAAVSVESILENDQEDYRLAYPALVLSRHSLELLLKAIIDTRPKKTHDLGRLDDDFEHFVEKQFG